MPALCSKVLFQPNLNKLYIFSVSTTQLNLINMQPFKASNLELFIYSIYMATHLKWMTLNGLQFKKKQTKIQETAVWVKTDSSVQINIINAQAQPTSWSLSLEKKPIFKAVQKAGRVRANLISREIIFQSVWGCMCYNTKGSLPGPW